MRCPECGGEIPGEERCVDRFHLLLAAEQHYPEAAAMHGLFVLTYYAQHPSLSKPWLRAMQRESLRRIFGESVGWREVLSWPEDRARRQEAVDRAKGRFALVPEMPTIGHPVEGEMTVADLGAPGSLDYPSEYPARVEAWARSVTEHRFLAN